MSVSTIFLLLILNFLQTFFVQFQKMIRHKWMTLFLALVLILKNIESKNIEDAECSLITEQERFDCHPEDGASELACGSRNCCWKFSDNINIPSCYYRKNWKIYDYEKIEGREMNENHFSAYLKLNGRSTYKNDLKLVKAEFTSVDAFTLRVKV